MHKEQLIKLIFDAYDNDLESTVNPIPIDDLLHLSMSQLWAIAIDLDLLGDELP
jgi:glucose dehydrogenase